MRYQSNLSAPDLTPHFKLLAPPLQIMGHDMPSDPDFEPQCGYFTHDEAAILYNVAKQVGGNWVDVGARFGWTGAHLMAANCRVNLVDPHLAITKRRNRLLENIETIPIGDAWLRPDTFSNAIIPMKISGVVIDGNHDRPEPLNDAITAHGATKDDCVVVLHDYWGEPIQEAVDWLQDAGYNTRIYCTPNGLAVCWRGKFTPPVHIPDPAIDWQAFMKERVK